MNKIKGIIFDLDGTIGNTLPLCIQAFRQAIEPLALTTLSDEEIFATFGPSEEGTIQTLIPDHYEKGIVNYLQFYEDLHDLCPDPFPGITRLLYDLRSKNIRIAMVTGKGKHSTAISLKKFGLEGFFEQIETGSPTGPVKVEGINAVLQQWKDLDKTSSIIYVGDSPGDITASRKAGIPVVAAAWAETAEPEKLKALDPDYIFYSIDEFSDWLRSMV
ncbi:MAG TPA: HAD family hydrolase [Puia sp.]|jgi:phosphoglycolate phosphatase/pyrophosphatase PpaX